MGLLSNGQLAQNGEFVLRVKLAMITAAKDTAASTEAANMEYDKLHRYAVEILNNPDSKVSAFAFAVASNAAITEASSDNDIQFTVNSLFKSMAGVRSSDAEKDIPTLSRTA